jgi:hypothetical protein
MMNDDQATKRVNLVWTSRGLGEEDWLRYLLLPIIQREVFAEKFEVVEAFSLYVISANKNLRRCVPHSFLKELGRVQGKGLIHVGDEYFAGGYDLYKRFDFVLRTHHTGWGRGVPQRSASKPPEFRKYIWSFLGNQKASSRPEMLQALRHIEPQFVYAYTAGPLGGQRMPPSQYHALLEDTVFAPCPMGNAVLETWRFYESLEAGCIPIIEARPWMHYHERLLGSHPIPAVYSWSQAASLIKTLSKDFGELRAMQRSIASWWAQCKESNRLLVGQFVSERIDGQIGNLSTRHLPSASLVWPLRRTVELLRHQSAMSLCRRVIRPLVRLVSKQRPLPSISAR